MNSTELNLYQSLSRSLGGKIIDPKYAPSHEQKKQTERLREWIRENWKFRERWPEEIKWVIEYRNKFKRESEGTVSGSG